MSRRQKKYHYIYKTTCNVNGKYYIGIHSTDNLEDGYLGSGKRLWYSINYHGKENHIKIILEYCKNRKELIRREKEIVNEQLLSEELCMNLKPGGSGGFVNEEHRKKFTESNNWGPSHERIKWLHENDPKWLEKTKQKIKDGLKNSGFKHNTFEGKKHSEETKKKMSQSTKGMNIGEKNSQYGTHWITNGVENKKIKKDVEIPNGWYKGRKF